MITTVPLKTPTDDEWNDLVELIGLLQLDITSKVSAVVDEATSRANWVGRLATAAAAKRQNTRHKQYLVWRKRVEDVAAVFRQASMELDGASDVIGTAIRDYSVIAFRDWENICQRGFADRTWLFSILCFADGQPFYKTIAYLKRHIPIQAADPFVEKARCGGYLFHRYGGARGRATRLWALQRSAHTAA